MADMQSKLYQVYGTIPEYRGHKNVPATLFVEGRQAPPVPYEQAIEGYAPGSKDFLYTEEYIKELFTEAEAAALVEYMSQAHPDTPLKVIEESLPVSSNIMGVGAIGVGGAQGFYELEKEEGYSLPFSVSLYYDLRGSETAQAEEPDLSFIAIRDNNTAAAQPCAICGYRADIEIGPWPFLGGDYGQPICLDCLQGEKPMLYIAWRGAKQGEAAYQREEALLSRAKRLEEALGYLLYGSPMIEPAMTEDEALAAALEQALAHLEQYTEPLKRQREASQRAHNVAEMLQDAARLPQIQDEEITAALLILESKLGELELDIPF